jgi:hypothetical protein
MKIFSFGILIVNKSNDIEKYGLSLGISIELEHVASKYKIYIGGHIINS